MVAVTPAYEREKVLVGQARMFVAKLTPGQPAPSLPEDTVPLNGDWGAEWAPVGATEEGLTLRFQRSTESIMIEEQLTPVATNTTSIDMGAEMVLSQDTLETMLLAYGGGVVETTAATATEPGRATLTIGSDLDHYAFAFEAANDLGKPRRVLIPDVVSVGQAETAYRRATQARRYATVFNALCAPEEVEIVDIREDPTGA